MAAEISQETIDRLEAEIRNLKAELNFVSESPFLQSSFKNLSYEVVLDREEVLRAEFGKKINEKHGTMYEIKTMAKRFATLLSLDSDMIRIMVTEAVQNILEHGKGKHVEIRFHINNDTVNPYMISSFKHEVPAGTKYTLSDINQNALRGDITSEYFDFESSRGRGEFIMKNLTDERRIINGIEVNREGQKVNYFRRILINYKNPQGARERVSFGEIKNEIDRLDYEDVVCCFHVQHHFDRPDAVTIATTKAHAPNVAQIMASQGFQLVEQEAYYRTIFATYSPPGETNKEQLLGLFAKVKQIVYQEVEGSNGGK